MGAKFVERKYKTHKHMRKLVLKGILITIPELFFNSKYYGINVTDTRFMYLHGSNISRPTDFTKKHSWRDILSPKIFTKPIHNTSTTPYNSNRFHGTKIMIRITKCYKRTTWASASRFLAMCLLNLLICTILF